MTLLCGVTLELSLNICSCLCATMAASLSDDSDWFHRSRICSVNMRSVLHICLRALFLKFPEIIDPSW